MHLFIAWRINTEDSIGHSRTVLVQRLRAATPNLWASVPPGQLRRSDERNVVDPVLAAVLSPVVVPRELHGLASSKVHVSACRSSDRVMEEPHSVPLGTSDGAPAVHGVPEGNFAALPHGLDPTCLLRAKPPLTTCPVSAALCGI